MKWVEVTEDSPPDHQLIRPDPLETNKLRIFVVTWNIAGKKPSKEDIRNLLFADQAHHDIYVVGS